MATAKPPRDQKQRNYKVVVIGKQSVHSSPSLFQKLGFPGSFNTGKTCLIHRFCSGTFMSDSTPTIGVDVRQKKIAIENNELNFFIWDTAGKTSSPSCWRFRIKKFVFQDKSDSATVWRETFTEMSPASFSFMMSPEWTPSQSCTPGSRWAKRKRSSVLKPFQFVCLIGVPIEWSRFHQSPDGGCRKQMWRTETRTPGGAKINRSRVSQSFVCLQKLFTFSLQIRRPFQVAPVHHLCQERFHEVGRRGDLHKVGQGNRDQPRHEKVLRQPGYDRLCLLFWNVNKLSCLHFSGEGTIDLRRNGKGKKTLGRRLKNGKSKAKDNCNCS